LVYRNNTPRPEDLGAQDGNKATLRGPSSYAGMSIGGRHVDLARAIVHDARKLHMERASVQAREAGEGERNVSLIFAEVRTDLMSVVRRYCNAVRAIEALPKVAEKRGRLRSIVQKRLPAFLMKSKVLGELEGIFHHAQEHTGPNAMWERLAAEIATFSAGLSSVGLASYRPFRSQSPRSGSMSRPLSASQSPRSGRMSRPLSALRFSRPLSAIRAPASSRRGLENSHSVERGPPEHFMESPPALVSP
jgi:hypothetical protein